MAMAKPQSANNDLARIVIDCVSRVSGVDASRISPETEVVFGLGMAGEIEAGFFTAEGAAQDGRNKGYGGRHHQIDQAGAPTPAQKE